jgi:hypothetical protein
MNYKHGEFESQLEFDVDVKNWSKRRRAILELLDNPRLPKTAIPPLHESAKKLAKKLEENNHPKCAHMIRMKLIGVDLDARHLR